MIPTNFALPWTLHERSILIYMIRNSAGGVFMYASITIFFLSMVVFFPIHTFGATGINAQIPFYGTLREGGGALVTGTYDMVFKIYDAPTGGTVLWTGNHTNANGNGVDVDDGVFQVMLGSGAGNAFSLDFNDDSYYLGISIGTDTEMTPRERLGATPYAFNSSFLDGLDATAFVLANQTLAQRITIATATVDTLVTLNQTGLGNILALFNNTEEVFTVLQNGNVGIRNSAPATELSVGGVISASSFEGLSGDNSTFGGGIVVAGDVTIAEGSRLFLGSEGAGLSFYQDTGIAQFGANSLVMMPYGEALTSEAEVKLLAPNALGFFANVGEDGSGTHEPALTLDVDGSARINSASQGDVNTSIFYIDFIGGVDVSTGDVRIQNGNMTISGTDTLGVPSLFVSGSGGLQVDNLVQDLDPAYLVSDTFGNITASRALTLDGDGNVHIQDENLTIDGGGIRVTNLAGFGAVPLGVDTDGNIIIDGSSDKRLKKNIRTIDDGLETLLNLRGVRYEWRDAGRFGSSTEVGFIAQELQKELPEVVRDTGEYLTINTKNITAVIVEAIKELYDEVHEYFDRTEALEREVKLLRLELGALKAELNVEVDIPEEVEEEPIVETDTPEEVAIPEEEIPTQEESAGGDAPVVLLLPTDTAHDE